MRITAIKLWCIALLPGLLLAMPAALRADNLLLPVIPEAQSRVSEAQGCVEPVEEMRKNHMEYILHQRDETMYKGIRTKQHSLEKCINCHVSDAPDTARYGDAEHFCSSCHTYASVQIDCFQCHADRPVKTSGHNPLAPGVMRLHGRPVIHEDARQADNRQTLAAEGPAHE
jgi:hypothetical protein